MDDLIKRLEAASGPDCELDAAIALTKGWVAPRIIVSGTSVSSNGFWKNPNGQECLYPTRYTASIDAALTLVPPAEKWPDGHADFTLDFQSGQCVCDFTCWVRGSEDNSMGSPLYVRAPTPALAICIAALKARGEP